MKIKKQIIALIIGAIVLVAGAVLSLGLPSWLGSNTPEVPGNDPVPEAGEGLYYNALLMYPQVSAKNIVSLAIKNEKGDFTLVQKWDSASSTYSLRLKNYQSIPCDESMTTILASYLGTPLTQPPIRNATEEQLKNYGVDESCKNGYTLVYETENREQKTVTVRIGDKVNSNTPTYYAYVEGRSNIYMLQAGVTGMMSLEEVFFKGELEYITPTIFKGFANATQALMGTDAFNVYKTTLEDKNGDGQVELTSLLSVLLKSKDKSKDTVAFELILERGEGGSKIALADNDFMGLIFADLFVEFKGESVVDIYTEDTDLSKYGLDIGQNHYFISAVFDETDKNGENRTFILDVSHEIDGYHYTIARFYDQSIGLIIKIPKEQLYFINEDDKFLLENYAATNTVLTGFYEYLHRDEEADEPGMKEITINTKDYKETFYIDYDILKGKLSVTTKNSGKTFIDVESDDVYERNQFSNLYTLLIFYPMPRRLNSMSQEELAEVMVEENMVYELIAERNDGKLLRYTYYKINASYAVAEYCEGQIEEGVKVWGSPTVVFDTTMGHVEKITDNYKIVMEGGKIRPDNIIY